LRWLQYGTVGARVADFIGLSRTFLRDWRGAFIAEEVDRAGKSERTSLPLLKKIRIVLKAADPRFTRV
jgi:hypothetical protein